MSPVIRGRSFVSESATWRARKLHVFSRPALALQLPSSVKTLSVHGEMSEGSAAEMSASTPGRKFYEEQIALLQPGRTDELIDRHYHEHAVLVTLGKVVRGRNDLKQYFRGYAAKLGHIQMVSLDAFVETDDAVLFEATVRTATGEARVYDAFVLLEGKAAYHFAGVK